MLGIPQISSSIESLSGQLCPTTVTFTCNALEFGSQVIDWYIDNTIVARYTFSQAHRFPLTIMPSVAQFMVQIASVNIINSEFNFINFTLSAQLDDLLQFQGQSLTCGTLVQRSTHFNIAKYEIVGKFMSGCTFYIYFTIILKHIIE